MTSFWDLSDGNKAESNGSMDMGGGNMEPIPNGTELLALIDEAKLDSYEDDTYISLRWTVQAPEQYKNRKIFQKVRVFDADPTKADKAKRMLMAIDHNCGGKLAASGEAPADHNMPAALCAKPMMIKVQIWEINDKSGNWVSSVAARNATPATQPANTDDNAKGDDIPF